MSTLPPVGKAPAPLAAVAHWSAIAAALTPAIGAQGFGAVFRRSLHLTKARFPALSSVGDFGPPFSSLRDALSELPDLDAGEIQASLLATFCDILHKLIGAQLTARLLPPLCGESSLPEQPSTQDRRI
jgi:hypothetical protein